jgi:ABC-2 type transport system permease protein
VTAPSTPAPPGGAVYDRGYRPYDGRRGGQGAARSALVRLSLRRALGIRRNWRQKVFPWALVSLATLPAVINVAVSYANRNLPFAEQEFVTHREYIEVSALLLLFVAATAPDLVCPDRRQRVTSLIFARPLTGDDYVLAKVGAMALLVFGFAFAPQVVLFFGQMLVSSDGALDYFQDNAGALWQVPVTVALMALLFAALGTAIAAATTRRVVGSVAILATWLVTATVASVASGFEDDSGGPRPSWWALTDVFALPLHLRDLVFLGHADPAGQLAGIEGGPAGAVAVYVVVVLASLAYLRWRYRTVPE